MSILGDRPARVHSDAGRSANVHIDHPDPPEVGTFRQLALARRRGDRSRLRELIAELLSYGWTVCACQPRQAGKAVRP